MNLVLCFNFISPNNLNKQESGTCLKYHHAGNGWTGVKTIETVLALFRQMSEGMGGPIQGKRGLKGWQQTCNLTRVVCVHV